MTGIRRSRSNDGTPSHCENFLPLSQRDLARLLAIFGPDAKVEKKVCVFHGPKAARGSPPVRLTDGQVLELRKLRDWHGKSRKEISDLTGLEPSVFENIITWNNRVHLDPGPRPVNVLEAI